MSVTDLKAHLALLHEERNLAVDAGIVRGSLYMADLDQEIASIRIAIVGASVTELASFQLCGPNFG